MSPNVDYTWKVLVGGMGGVGKTTLILRYLTGQFFGDTALTIGVEFHNHVLEHEGKTINLILWDLGGEERFRFIQGTFMQGARAAFVVFDLSRYATIAESRKWVDLIRSNNTPEIPILLVGAKEDLCDEETLRQAIDDAESLVQEMNLQGFIATSSKWGKNVGEAIQQLVEVLLQQVNFL